MDALLAPEDEASASSSVVPAEKQAPVVSLDLQRCVLRLPASSIARLDEIAKDAGLALGRNVPRTAVMRAAILAWLEVVEELHPELVIEAIRLAVVKRGRKSPCSRARLSQGAA